MKLDLDIEVGDLTPRDIDRLEDRAAPVKAPPIKRLKERHHALARALASGLASGEAAMAVGYSPSRVSILLADPTFKQLVEHYRAGVEFEYRELHAKMAALGMEAVEELHERLDENPEGFTNTQLRDLATSMVDRVGHGPSSKQEVNVNVNLAERLEAARRRVASIDLEAKDVTDAEQNEEAGSNDESGGPQQGIREETGHSSGGSPRIRESGQTEEAA